MKVMTAPQPCRRLNKSVADVFGSAMILDSHSANTISGLPRINDEPYSEVVGSLALKLSLHVVVEHDVGEHRLHNVRCVEAAGARC